MLIVLAILIFITPYAAFLLLCSWLAIWCAFGNARLFLRMPAFLLGSWALGFSLCLARADSESAVAGVCAMALIVFSLFRTHWAWQLLAFVCGAGMLVSLVFRLESNSLDSSWIVRVTLATSFAAAALALLKHGGWRIVNLTGGISHLAMEQGTGRDLDDWIMLLDEHRAMSLNHAQIMAFLRQFGFSFDWQRMVTVAYERALGRRTVAMGSHGRPLVIEGNAGGREIRPAAWLQQQFTIWQLLSVTFCVASLLGFVRLFRWEMPNVLDVKIGVPLVAGGTAITMAALCSCLAIREVRKKCLFAALVVALVVAGIPHLLHIPPVLSRLYLFLGPAMLGYSVTLMLSLVLLRRSGYRLVRVQSAR